MDKIKFNYSKLRVRIKEIFGTNEKFAEALEVARVTINHKMGII